MDYVNENGRSEKLWFWATVMPEVIAWYFGGELRQFAFKKQGQDWLLVVAITKKGRDLVSFTSGHDLIECLSRFSDKVRTNGVEWKQNRYPL